MLENVLVYPIPDGIKPSKLKRIRITGSKEYMMAISKSRPLIIFKEVNKDMHYTMLIRIINQKTIEIDLHKTFENKEVRHIPIIKIRFGIKEDIQGIEKGINKMKDIILPLLHPLTEDELNSAASCLNEGDIYYIKELTISPKNIYKSTLRELQENGNFPIGIAKKNGNMIGIILNEGKYYEFDLIELISKMTYLFDIIIDYITIIINGIEKKQTSKESIAKSIKLFSGFFKH